MQMDWAIISLNMAYLQVVTIASSLSSLRHVRLLHRRAYSIITELAEWHAARCVVDKRFNENPSLHESNINITVLSFCFSVLLRLIGKTVEHMWSLYADSQPHNLLCTGQYHGRGRWGRPLGRHGEGMYSTHTYNTSHPSTLPSPPFPFPHYN